MNSIIAEAINKAQHTDHPKVWLAAAAAGTAYLAEQPLDNRLLNYKHDDIELQGKLLLGNTPYWRAIGLFQHYSFTFALTYIYVAYLHDRLPGPEWLRGLIFINLELAALTPLVIPLDKFHPAVRSGEMNKLGNLKGQLNQIMRHAAYGLTLGLVWGALRKK